MERLVKNHNGASVAFVFGNERTGLDDEELNFCNIASHIPVSEAFPSLNLSHAVQIYAYELFLALGEASHDPVKGEWIPLERPAVDELTADITGTLAALGFYKTPGRGEQTRFLRNLICRAGLTEREGRYLKDIFIKAARLGSKEITQ
jgi:tRNA/rRNA methyltransferase/tRNA (cytidine32/uridine32-2'-O)-methyltransferase